MPRARINGREHEFAEGATILEAARRLVLDGLAIAIAGTEERAIETVQDGAPRTEFMKFGDTVRMQGTLADGRAPFGVIEAKVVKA